MSISLLGAITASVALAGPVGSGEGAGVAASPEVMAAQLDLTHPALMVAGCSQSICQAVMNELASRQTQINTIFAHEQAASDSAASLTELARQIELNPFDSQLREQHAQARQAAASHNQQAQQAAGQLKDDVTSAAMTAQEIKQLDHINTRHARGLAYRYCVLDLSQEQIRRLHRLTIDERRALRRGETLEPEDQQFLDSIRNDYAVQNAQAVLNAAQEPHPPHLSLLPPPAVRFSRSILVFPLEQLLCQHRAFLV